MDPTVASFLEHLIVEKGFSRNTSDAYRNDLSQFHKFLQDETNDEFHGNGSHSESSTGSFTWAKVDTDIINSYIQDLQGATANPPLPVK